MGKQDGKERLLEVMNKIDSTFKSKLNEDKSWFEGELGYLKNNQTFTRVELRDILETLYKNVDIIGQYRIMSILQLFGMDEDFK